MANPVTVPPDTQVPVPLYRDNGGPARWHGASDHPAGRLAGELRDTVRGEVRFDEGSRALYATDASNYREVPIGVVVPRDADDVVATVAACRRHAVPVLARGAGTSLAGQCCNVAVVLDCSKYMNEVVAIDPERRVARVQPGVVLDRLREAVAAYGLTFGPDPATHKYCTVGGMIGNNSCGVHSVMSEFYGPGPMTSHNIEALEVLTYDGTRMRIGSADDAALADAVARGGREGSIARQIRSFRDRHAERIRREFPQIPRCVSGYNIPALLPEHGGSLAQAFVGSECTLGFVLEATVRLIPAMPHRVLVVLGFDDVYAAAERVPDVRQHRPVGLEGLDVRLADDMRRSHLRTEDLTLLPEGDGWLIVEFGADTREEAEERAQAFASDVRGWTRPPVVKVVTDPHDQERLWVIRESGLAATARVSGQNPTWPGWEDSAVPPDRLAPYLRDLRALFEKFGYEADLYGHFGQGCVHCRIDFDLRTAAGIVQFRRFLEEAADLVHRYGGSLSGEHGDGQARGELLPRMFSPELIEAFREFKSIWDPDWRFNPGKIIDARPLDANLRLGTGYNPVPVETHFRFPDDLGSFAHAALRCVGVGKCRKTDGGTMCPSYMVTGEEKHTTRGRAHLLFEMLQDTPPLRDGWDSEAVREALDLCLACKGCKGECPVHVDVATYKAEFLSHYYERHWRPRVAWAFGLIRTWARLASPAPRLVNVLTQTPGLRGFAKRVAGVAPSRRIPPFAPRTFRHWFLARPAPPRGTRPRVILWPDTFNDHFHPETALAALHALEYAGFHVEIPVAPLCCGRPLYDYGMLTAAKRRLLQIMDALHDEIAAGVPIVGLEPSCVSVFRDELPNLFPGHEQARRLKAQVFTFAEFLQQHAERLPSRAHGRRALVHGHCHQKALADMAPDLRLLDRLGVDCTLLDAGCCGMAGSFGFEDDHYDISMAIGERVLLPAVRDARADTLVVADGFSCREQIAQGTRRRAMHTAEVVAMALRGPG